MKLKERYGIEFYTSKHTKKRPFYVSVMTTNCMMAKMLAEEIAEDQINVLDIIQEERTPDQQGLKQSLVIDDILALRARITNKSTDTVMNGALRAHLS